MARKWHTFYRPVESFFLKPIPSRAGFVRRRAYRLLVLLVLGLFLSVGISPVFSQIPFNQSQNGAEELVEQGQICYENEQVSEAVNSLSLEELVEQGQICYEKGQISEAVNSLQRAIEIFKTQNDWANLAITSTNLSRIFQELGQYTRSCSTLEQVLKTDLQFCQDQEFTEENLEKVSKTFQQLPDRIQVPFWRSFGDVLRVIGRLKESEMILNKSLSLAEKLPNDPMSRRSNAQAAALLSLGNTYRAWGNLERDRLAEPKYEYIPWRCENQGTFNQEIQGYYDEARRRYEKVIIREPPSEEDDPSAQKEKYQQLVIKQSKESSLSAKEIKAQLNLLSLLVEIGEVDYAQKLSEFIQLSHLPMSRVRVYSYINLAKSLTCLKQKISTDNLSEEQIQLLSWENINNLLATAFQNAKKLEDRRAASYALGDRGGLYEYLGWLYEQPQQEKKVEESQGEQKLCQESQQCREEAKQWTEKALELLQRREEDETLSLIQLSENPELGYQWQWQLGRLLEAEGQREEAIANYEAAIETLESVRDDLLAINSDVQFNFRDNVEPLYRELVALFLPVGEKNPPQEKLKQALYYIDSLQLAELENFLRCNLQGDIETVQIQRLRKPNERIEELFTGIDRILDNYPTKAAFIYPIVLQKQISVILKLPGKDQQLQYHQTEIEQYSVTETLNKVQETLSEKSRITSEQKKPLQQLYQWIIGKFATDLKQDEIQNLIFVLDNYFRVIPMSALLDGEQFVVEKEYVTTVVPGVQLLRYSGSEPTQLNALIVGSIEDRRPKFPPIQESVNKQINSILENLTDFQILAQGQFQKETLGKFTKETLQKELQKSFYGIVHMVTHGQFSSDPEETFILTDDESDNFNKYSLKINELGRLLQTRDKLKPIELFFLSSCRTAAGDNRAVLGIAGIAVKSGARGTIAPLWYVDTTSSNVLVKEFYENLFTKQVSKAEALHLAQKSLRKYKNGKFNTPYHWAPFVLVGN